MVSRFLGHNLFFFLCVCVCVHIAFWKCAIGLYWRKITEQMDSYSDLVQLHTCLYNSLSGTFRRHCIWGVSDLEQALPSPVDLVLRDWAAHSQMSICSKEMWWSAPCWHVLDAGIFHNIRRKYIILFVKWNKGHYDMGKRKELSTKRICAACHGNILLGSIQCCTMLAS